MPTCAACHADLDSAARFCPACGAPSSPDLTAPDTIETPASSRPPSGPSHHGRFEPGQRLGERYRIVGLLGQGGMGEVYRADDLELGQSVALKFLPDRLVADPVELERFRREVRVARGVAHPNVCRTYDIATAGDHVFLVMEYVDGEDLASALRRMGRPSPDKALEIARQLCLGVGAAHEAGVLHRDLKPANIMIDGRGKVRITDFGLAGLAEELAEENVVAGTPAYMAPEQLAEGRVSTASDVFSLGLVLHEVFTGKRVFDSHNVEEIRRLHSESRITSPSTTVQDLDPVVERVLTRCLDSEPAARPQTAYAVLAALPGGDPLAAALAAGETPSPELVADAGVRGAMRPRTAAAVLLCCLALLFGVAQLQTGRLEQLERSPAVLSVEADRVFEAVVGGDPPAYTGSGLAPAVPDSLLMAPGDGDLYLYWHLWSPGPLPSDEFHNQTLARRRLNALRLGDVALLLDMQGVVQGFRRALPESLEASGTPEPDGVFALLGLSPADYRRAPESGTPGTWTWQRVSGDGPREVRAVFHGDRLVRLRAAREPFAIDTLFDQVPEQLPMPVAGAVVFSLLPLVAAGFLAWRNARLGRGDRRGANLFALVTFTAYLLEAALHLSLDRMSAGVMIMTLTNGPGIGHALFHAAFVWLGYLALEPYLRRIRPGSLISWARVVGGRWRDPIVGRDVLVGALLGLLAVALMRGASVLALRWNGTAPDRLLGESSLGTLLGVPDALGNVAYSVAYSGPAVMLAMVFFLLFRMVLRRNLAAAIAVPLVPALIGMLVAPEGFPGWLVMVNAVVGGGLVMWGVFGFGVLAGVTFALTFLLWTSLPWALAPGAWYGTVTLVAPVLLAALAGWAAVTAMGGAASLAGVLGDDGDPGTR